LILHTLYLVKLNSWPKARNMTLDNWCVC